MTWQGRRVVVSFGGVEVDAAPLTLSAPVISSEPIEVETDTIFELNTLKNLTEISQETECSAVLDNRFGKFKIESMKATDEDSEFSYSFKVGSIKKLTTKKSKGRQPRAIAVWKAVNSIYK